ncbi:MAG: hypothetical protein C0410_03105 [Anaerolinea sp.]|nr:hypothetical protein [Anaerolinea sp.]
MADNICPICQRPNDANAERCWYCQAELTPNEQPTPVNGTDWLNGLREESVQSTEPETPEPTGEPEKPEEVPDWLARIRTREQMERETQTNSQTSAQSEPPAAEKKEELPDWLKEIKAGYSGKKSDSENEESAPDSVSPFAPSAPEEKKSAASNLDQSDDTDEWLSRLAAWKPIEEQGSSESVSTEPEEVIPEQENSPQSHFDLDSLAALHQAEFRPFELNRGDGWQKLETDEPQVEPEVTPKEEQQLSFEDIKPPEEELPKSSFDINALRETIAVQQSNPDFFTEQNLPNEELEEDDLSEDDLLDFTSPVVEKTETPLPENPIFSEASSEFLMDESAISPFVPDDLPDWLATAKLEKPEKHSSEPVAEELDASGLVSEIEKGNLPAWLQAARTPAAEPVKADEEESQEEGLLAGISGTLQSQSLGVDIRKPVGYGSALKVSERQKRSANLFANLVDETLEISDLGIPKKNKNQRILWRLAVAFAFILIIFLSKSVLAPYLIQPALFPPEVVSVYDQVSAIPVDKPVLLTGDFEAAVAGELSWSSQSLLEHLMRRNLDLVILSSNPSGSAMMTQLIQNAAKNVEGYDLSTHLITLGYLPGGATGVQLLAGNPRTAMPYTHNLDAAWNSDILHSVNVLSDFGALIVLSDKSESSRAWVEQIQPGLGTTPLMFVVSAQAAPLLQPYYQSGQISGYVAGFYGSLAYEQMLQQSNDVLAHLGAFQSAMLLAAVMILIGGLVTLIRPAAPVSKG